MFTGGREWHSTLCSPVSPGKHSPLPLSLSIKKQNRVMGMSEHETGIERIDLEDIVERIDPKNIIDKRAIQGGSATAQRVYFLSEVGYDTDYFNETAYENLLKVMGDDKELSHIIIDGAMSRLDRPEFLNKALTYWEKDERACRHASKNIKNREQYGVMSLVQRDIIRKRLKEMRARVPDARITLSLHSDDLQYTASAMLNEIMLRKGKEIGENIEQLKTTRRHQKQRRGEFQKRYDSLIGKKGKANDRRNYKRRIQTCSRKIDGVEDEIQNQYDEQRLYREKKVRPAHQYFTREFMESFVGMYREMCEELDIDFVAEETTLDLDGFRINYSHSRHKTWFPVKARDKALVKEIHGKLDILKDVDVVLESGHFGIGYKQLQKMKDHPDESNFKNQSSYDPNTEEQHVTIVMGLPFEDQKALSEYRKGRKAVRMSGGKPMSTRKIAATDRQYNGSVSGLTILTKDAEGIVGTEWIQYENFVDGSVLDQPEEYTIICASSDEHIGSPEESPIARDGWLSLFEQLVEEPSRFRGSPAIARGYINAGDIAEANSRKWDHRYHAKRDPQELMKENLTLLRKFKPDSIDEVIKLATKMTQDAMGGSVESMRVLLERAADYLESFLDPCISSRSLRWAQVCTTGNHSDAVLRDLGMRETDYYVQRLRAKGIGVNEVGQPDYHLDPTRGPERVFVGGYSNARIAHVPDYGKAIDGSTLFGPISMVVQHDPKGSGMLGVIGAAKNTGADLAIAGHTHDNRMKLTRVDDGKFQVAYRLGTLQGVSPTEKYYASSVPRTQAAQLIVMPMPGDFSEKAIPAYHLRDRGARILVERAGGDSNG